MNVVEAANNLAQWLSTIREEGRPCPTNITQSAVMVLGCTREIARRVREQLVRSGRFVCHPIRNVYIIDGKHFAQKVLDKDEVAEVKTILRRRYRPVIDPRTVEDPNTVADGVPVALIVGANIMSYERARAIATEMAAH